VAVETPRLAGISSAPQCYTWRFITALCPPTYYWCGTELSLYAQQMETVSHTYSITAYGNIIFLFTPFHIHPLFEEHNYGVKQGFGVLEYLFDP
jgi:hypothetical protein